MKIISWNVNGIRAVAKKGFSNFLSQEKPDILCVQEIKISDSARNKEEFDFLDYQEYWNSSDRPGYSGTLILVKNKLAKDLEISNHNGLNIKKFDIEGRAQTIEFKKFYLVNAYFPNANHELSRLNYKLEFNSAIHSYLKKLKKKKPVIITGDFNVAHQEIDLARPKDNINNPGFTNEERFWMDKFLSSKFIDTYRHFNKNKIQYTWWSYRAGVRARNIGWRIDYFCASEAMMPYIKKSYILDKVYGSDHCPIGVEMKNI